MQNHMYIYIITGPPTPVSSLMASEKCSRYFIVAWNLSSSDSVCGPVSYDVTMSPSDGVMMMRITNTFYNFTGLTPGTNYTVTVAGINMAGIGESNMIMFYIPIATVNIVVPCGEFH